MNKNNGNADGGNADDSFEGRLDSLKDSVRGLADIGSERASDIKHRVIDAKDGAVSSVETYLDRAKKMIVANPLAAIGIAFGVGYLAMRIVRR